MPALIPRACRKPGCPDTTTERSGYCTTHRHEGWQQHQQGQSRQARGYGAQWQRLRARILTRDNYLCQPCWRQGVIRSAQAVDHIQAKAFGGTDEERNLEAICHECHKAKTARERFNYQR
ncbi:HNH endonuclease [Candidatus Williamhamiltonella defendens]|uniref:Putative HNH nuclease YajD n=1 Tax=Candidatus Williamhamiltonella defendens TaxID=138072 RepID=A0A2D3TD91_9ENTR|nr:HNH endonuclease signature motif containing protein [Candidatus Hamiltonella defensa]ATW33664.1 HNH endonuclease [Candidatus Hamiltonella defensa]